MSLIATPCQRPGISGDVLDANGRPLLVVLLGRPVDEVVRRINAHDDLVETLRYIATHPLDQLDVIAREAFTRLGVPL